ncbi:Sulfur carrier protein TusA [wastewater metagenome]|uniref:Sulfur carrier protein TusA n=2 Tax=unclassified sequences TaxID=12908 RepID=A0A5B8RDP5_9ZZZZ|nr:MULTISPECIES: sulfurtransferase TusA family protein [Arhodomonas]MCS4505329.1 sulfurtransferase TusA family protein [Arhodomonas aquaeolei]QEA06018.1 sulfur carrier protein TusA [uncultured organism]
MAHPFDSDLDVRGLNCPLPILKTKKALIPLPAGAVLRVRATDPHSVIDFTAFCDKTDNTLVARDEDDGVHTFYVSKG